MRSRMLLGPVRSTHVLAGACIDGCCWVLLLYAGTIKGMHGRALLVPRYTTRVLLRACIAGCCWAPFVVRSCYDAHALPGAAVSHWRVLLDPVFIVHVHSRGHALTCAARSRF